MHWLAYGFRHYDPVVGRFTGVDPLAADYAAYSPFHYTLNNPIRFIDPGGRFPIDPKFRANYPRLTNFIENDLQGYLSNSPRMMAVMNKYSSGYITKESLSSDFKSNQGPPIIVVDEISRGFSREGMSGHFDYETGNIEFGDGFLNRLEGLLEKTEGNAELQSALLMDFTSTFINEYVHYGDFQDGFDMVIDENGEWVNSVREPHMIDDEGNAAKDELFPYPTGRQNYFWYKKGELWNVNHTEMFSSDSERMDQTMIPKN